MTLTGLELIPNQSLGQFTLGSTLFSTLNLLQSHRSQYPNVKISYHDSAPSTSPVLLSLSTPSLNLTFDPHHQRLQEIELMPSPDGVARVVYRGKEVVFGGPGEEEEEGAVRVIRRVMGPTYDASTSEEDAEEGEEMLKYPGVAFGVKGGNILSRILLLPTSPSSSSGAKSYTPPLSVSSSDLSLLTIHTSSLIPTHITLHFYNPSTRSFVLRIGESTNEDLLSELGAPVRGFWKEDDRMTIHSTTSASSDLALNPYFVSYPSHGLTFLLSPPSNTITKIILHSNIPGEVHFGRNATCIWEVVDGDEEEEVWQGSGKEVLKRLQEGGGEKPMILDRTADGVDKGLIGKKTEIHGFEGIAMEVTEEGEVETVWLF